MEKRTHKRLIAIVECHRSNEAYFGTIVNASETGMFIRSQKLQMPLDINFEIIIPANNELLKLKVKIIRMAKLNGYYDSIGVEVVTCSEKYISFINNLKSDG